MFLDLMVVPEIPGQLPVVARDWHVCYAPSTIMAGHL